MLDLLNELCVIDGTGGDEGAVRDYICRKIDGFCDWRIDPLGNILVHKKGAAPAVKKVYIDAHMDEVGLIITRITQDGFLRFAPVGGFETPAMMFRRVRINGKIAGVIGGKPIHLMHGDEPKKLPKPESLYIDIGASSKEEAEALVSPGDRAVIMEGTDRADGMIRSKALDDRVGCAILIAMLREDAPFDYDAAFTVQEEVGCRGAKAAAYTVDPDAAVILEATTAADLSGVPSEKQVCYVGKGAVVSFMDRGTVYDRDYYNAALASGIPCQPKCAVAGGNNAGAVHLSRGGVRSVAVSVPCRYIHSASCTADTGDMEAAYRLAVYLRDGIAGGSIR